SLGPIKDEYSLMSIDEIMNGKADGFIGLIPLVNAHLDSVEVDRPTRKQIDKYLDFVSKRASGELLTEASWIRQFVQNHPAYRHDSVISPEVNYDLLRAIERIIRGEYRPEGLY
ncbi:glutamate--cysteine ligase, partial [Tieghemiomyces parasiticus]